MLNGPLEELTVDAVAERAEVSRALVFHYFPTIRDLQSAAAGSACAELVQAVQGAIEGIEQGQRFNAGLEAFVDFVQLNPQTFEAISQMAMLDAEFNKMFEGARGQMVELMIEHIDAEIDAFTRQLARGWVALAETVIQQWSVEPSASKDELVTRLIGLGRSLIPDLDAAPA